MTSFNKMQLTEKAAQEYPYATREAVEARVERLCESLIPELEPNVAEWVEGKEISDIWIGDFCINKIKDIRRDDRFLDAMEALLLYAKDEKAGIRAIWRTKK